MKKDRLIEDKDEIHNLDDLIEARNPGTSHLASDPDAFSRDFELPEDTDVEEALTFPHPKRRKSETIELMDTPHKEDMDEDWDDQDILPSDYSHHYEEATLTDPRDDEDAVAEDQMRTMDHLDLNQTADEPEIEVMPKSFKPDEDDARSE